jgi:hypothetical protein
MFGAYFGRSQQPKPMHRLYSRTTALAECNDFAEEANEIF